MSAKRRSDSLRTWVEIDARAARKNYDTFRRLIGRKVKLWAVVKSNAYGHGLFAFTKLANDFGIDGFCVDSLVEGVALRKKAGIKRQILVLGPTLPSLYGAAVKNNIVITISNFKALRDLAQAKAIPEFHIKIDTGMHRQGFYPEDAAQVIKLLSSHTNIKLKLTGIYTHFAAAKNIKNTAFTDKQFAKLQGTIKIFEKAGFKNLIKHASATGGTLLGPKYHLQAVRIGIGLHGLWPSEELESQLSRKIKLYPTLSWRTVVSEVKKLKKGDYVGYDLTWRAKKETIMAVLPIGYWHGFSRSLSNIGEVLFDGRRGKVLGTVSMDLIAVEAPRGVKPGDVVTMIGAAGREKILAAKLAKRSGTTHYEFLTRLNPLMERVVV